jgi:fumarate hydratase, class II
MPPRIIPPSTITKQIPKVTSSYAKVLQAKFRTERDTFGDLQVPADRYWGAQTQRCAKHFISSSSFSQFKVVCYI